MKIWDILRSASSNLWRNKGRTVLTIIAIFIGAFTIALTVGIRIGVNDYIDQQIGNVGGENELIIQAKQNNMPDLASDEPQPYTENKEKSDADAGVITASDMEKIRKTKNIKSAAVYPTFSTDYIQGKNEKKYIFSATSSANINIELSAGKAIDDQSSDYQIDLAPEYVKAMGFKSAKAAVGQTVKLAVSSQATGEKQMIEAKIVGVRSKSLIQGGQSTVNKSLADKLVAINEDGLPEQMKNRYYIATATMKSGLTAKEVTVLKDTLDKEGFTAMTLEDQIGIIRSVINAITGVLTMFGAIALLAASFGIINTLYMSVQERTREIGLMKAMGLGNGKIFTLFSVEALLIGFWGSVVGILGAMGAGALINQVAADSFLKNLDGLTLIQFSPTGIIGIVVLIMLIAFLAGTFPATRASRLDPINALRYE